ncbi:MAG: topB [Rhodoferax sp.]|nr:topB [Rhodoferax sp.]
MRLFIAEKPSAAKDLAAFLGMQSRGKGSYQCAGDVVTHCVGHLLESAEPEEYDPTLKAWRIDALPIVPTQFKYLPKAKTKEQLTVIGQLLKQATSVVNFGDPDNEGQLLVDEVLEHFKYRGTVQRLWLQALDPEAIEAGLRNLRPNENYAGMRDAARARGQADWLVGMNFSRAYTLAAQAKGGAGVRPVGRVQTPTLSLVADRCTLVANFKTIPYFTLNASVAVAAGEFKMQWKPGEHQAGMDWEKRLVDRAVADALVSKLTGVAGTIDKCEVKSVIEQQPRAFSLMSLTVLASKAFGYKAAHALHRRRWRRVGDRRALGLVQGRDGHLARVVHDDDDRRKHALAAARLSPAEFGQTHAGAPALRSWGREAWSLVEASGRNRTMG